MKFKNQVNLVYDGRTQQKGRAANDDQEGAQESSLGKLVVSFTAS